jgi:hypothetical protein
MQVYELFDGSSPGAYWFYAPGPQCWVVADLDTGKASQSKDIVRMDLTDDEAELDTYKCALAMVGSRGVFTKDKALQLLRRYPDAFDADTMISYEGDGTQFVGPQCGKTLLKVAGTLRKMRNNHTQEG